MEIRSLQPFGVEVVGCDLSDATDDDVRRIYDAMESDNGCGVVCLRDQDLTPEALERGLGRFAKHFGALIRYDRWPGQSRGVRGCQHLALLGNYRARRDGEIVEGCRKGEQIGEFKPAFKKASCELPNAKSRSSALTNAQRRQRKACSDDISSYRAFLHDF